MSVLLLTPILNFGADPATTSMAGLEAGPGLSRQSAVQVMAHGLQQAAQ
jgi:hypothetical protein